MSSKFLRSLAFTIAAITSTAAAPALAGNFGYGNLVVDRMGDGTATTCLGSTAQGAAIFAGEWVGEWLG